MSCKYIAENLLAPPSLPPSVNGQPARHSRGGFNISQTQSEILSKTKTDDGSHDQKFNVDSAFDTPDISANVSVVVPHPSPPDQNADRTESSPNILSSLQGLIPNFGALTGALSRAWCKICPSEISQLNAEASAYLKTQDLNDLGSYEDDQEILRKTKDGRMIQDTVYVRRSRRIAMNQDRLLTGGRRHHLLTY